MNYYETTEIIDEVLNELQSKKLFSMNYYENTEIIDEVLNELQSCLNHYSDFFV